MRNRFPSVCYRCGNMVAAGEGHFEKIKGPRFGLPKWRTQHASCAIEHRDTRTLQERNAELTPNERTKRRAARRRKQRESAHVD